MYIYIYIQGIYLESVSKKTLVRILTRNIDD